VALLAPDVKLDSHIEDHLVVGCDRDLITQVIQNLLSNAIKYNQPQGYIRIKAHHQPQRVTLTIANASHPSPWMNAPTCSTGFTGETPPTAAKPMAWAWA
jgi:signal transduction histidine kinase